MKARSSSQRRPGDVLYNAERFADALATYERAVALAESAADPALTELPLARPLARVGEALLRLDRVDEAIAMLERAVAVHQRLGVDSEDSTDAQSALERARWAAAGSPVQRPG